MPTSDTTLSLTPLRKAVASLAEALDQPFNSFTRDASILRFRNSIELSWKMIQRYLKRLTPTQTTNVKDLFREAARLNLIESSESWFEYLKARNLTSHTYNEITAAETYDAAKKFLPDAIKLLANLEAAIGD